MMSGSGMGEKCGNTVIENLPDATCMSLFPVELVVLIIIFMSESG